MIKSLVSTHLTVVQYMLCSFPPPAIYEFYVILCYVICVELR